MSFLDKILDSDVDEKAVSDMQQSLQSEIFSSQQQQQPQSSHGPSVSYTSQSAPMSQSYSYVTQPSVSVKREPAMSQSYSLMPLSQQQHGGSQEQHQPITVMSSIKSEAGQGNQQQGNQGHQGGMISMQHLQSNTVPTAVIAPQRTALPHQVIAVSSSVLPGQFTVQTVAGAQGPQTIMVSTGGQHAQVTGVPMRPNMMSAPQGMRLSNPKGAPMIVPIQPMSRPNMQKAQIQPIPIQPAMRPPQQQGQQQQGQVQLQQGQQQGQPGQPGQQQGPRTAQNTAAILSSMSIRESVQKLKAFLTNLLSISNKQDAATGTTVKDLIGKVMTANIDEDTFLSELQVALKSPPQPHLLVFLKQSVPVLRMEMQRQRLSLLKQQTPAPSPPISHTPFPGLAPVQTSGGHSVSQSHNMSQGSHQQNIQSGPTFSAPQRTFADKYKKKYTLSRDDEDINDVTSMAGVNLTEESAKISVLDHVPQEQRNTQDVTLLSAESMSTKISRISERYGLRDSTPEVKTLLSHAVEARLKDLMEKLVAINHHRLDLNVQDDQVIQTSNVKGQLKVLEKIQIEEAKKKADRAKSQMLKEAKSRSKHGNPEAKDRAKKVKEEEEKLIRQREANETALAAIGGRKRVKQEEGPNMLGQQGRRFKQHRINLRDIMFLCESDHFLNKSELSHRLHIK